MVSDAVLRRDWDSEYRPVRDMAAVGLTMLALVAIPYGLLWNELRGQPIGQWGAALGGNGGLVLVAGLWTLLVASVYGGQFRAAFRSYRRRS